MSTPPEQRRTAGILELLLGVKPPGAGSPSAPRRKGLLLFLLPTPLLMAALGALAGGRLGTFLSDVTGFALFMLAAYLTRRGIVSAHNQQRLRFTRLERVPVKTVGGLLLGVASAFTAYFAVGHGVGIALAFAAVACAGFHLLYGFEPLTRPSPFDTSDERARRVAEALGEAERRLVEVERSAAAIGNLELKSRLGRIAAQGRGILDQIADRPTDLFRARKFLAVYLEGVQQVTEGYARTHRLADSRELEQNFRTVLVTVERVFEEQRQKLLKTDVIDLDVQIEVLQKQLEREGIV